MKVCIDLRALQVGHQYRGIGEVVKRVLNGIFALAATDTNPPEFIFYEYDYQNDVDPKQFLDIPDGIQYSEKIIGRRPAPNVDRSKSARLADRWHKLVANPVPGVPKCDVFLQFDHDLGVPTNRRTVLVEHDIIPYIFWKDYFTSPWVHVRHHAARTTLRELEHNISYKRNLKRSLRNARKIVCVSECTRQDLRNYLGVSLKKTQTVLLGVSKTEAKSSQAKTHSSALPTKPYLLFVGAVDARRRRVDDIVAAFNNLKADGHDIQLVLAGENFQEPAKIPNLQVRKEILSSSYKNDILTLGYIDDATKHQLYKDALAFVFPTIYEGFGIPVLEAMLLGCPVIAYRNSSIPEVGGDAALYAKDWTDIWSHSETLLAMNTTQREAIKQKGFTQASKFSWDKTAKQFYRLLVD